MTKLKRLKKTKGQHEYSKKVLEDVVQGSIVLNKAYGNMTVHFHFEGTAGDNEIKIKPGEKIVIEAKKLNYKRNSSHWGSQGLYKLPISRIAFIGDCNSIDEFKKKCDDLDS